MKSNTQTQKLVLGEKYGEVEWSEMGIANA